MHRSLDKMSAGNKPHASQSDETDAMISQFTDWECIKITRVNFRIIYQKKTLTFVNFLQSCFQTRSPLFSGCKPSVNLNTTRVKIFDKKKSKTRPLIYKNSDMLPHCVSFLDKGRGDKSSNKKNR